MKTSILYRILPLAVCMGGITSGQADVIAYYRMEGDQGSQIGETLTDSSGNHRDITVAGATEDDKYVACVAEDPSPIPQTDATNDSALNIHSMSLDSGGISLAAPSDPAWNNIFAKQEFTIEGWFSPGDYLYGQNINIANRGNSFANGWALIWERVSQNSGSLVIRSGGTSVKGLTITGLTGAMNYFSVVGHDTGDISFTCNGQTATIPATAYTAATDKTSTIKFFGGEKIGNFQIDEVRFSDTALTSSQLLNSPHAR